MSDAFKCDRCGGFEEGQPLNVEWEEPGTYKGGNKDLCKSCVIGLVGYITGTKAEQLNEWDIHGCNDD